MVKTKKTDNRPTVTTVTKTVKIGNHRGNGRVWLQGKWLLAAGFGDHITVEYRGSAIKVVACDGGTVGARKVTVNKRGAIIDLCNAQIRETLGAAKTVKVDVRSNGIIWIGKD